MKKFLSIILCFATVFSLSATAFAAEQQMTVDKVSYAGHLINEDGTISSATIDEVDNILLERSKAILNGNIQQADELESELYDLGVSESTPAEISAFADGSSPRMLLASSNVTFTTSTYYATANGQSYQVKRTDALPTTSSNLFHSASVNNITSSASVAAGSFELCKVLGVAAVGVAYPATGAYITAYDALKAVITGLTPSTVIYGITASYACAALEQCSFYQYKTTSGYWTPFAASSYVQTGFSSTIFSTSYSGGSKQGLNMQVSTQEDTIYSPSSYNTGTMLERYFQTYIFDKKSQVTSVFFEHEANGSTITIKSLGMLCPTTTSEIT